MDGVPAYIFFSDSLMAVFFIAVRKDDNMIDLKQGDCLELMKDIPDKSVDMVLCDLPYGTTNCKWDSIIPFDKLWAQYKRITKEHAPIVLFGVNPFSAELIHSNIKNYKYSWVWNKHNAGNFLVAKYQPLKITEDICVFSYGRANYYPILVDGYSDNSNHKPGKQKSDLFSNIKSGQFKSGNNKKGTQRYPKNIIVKSNAIHLGKQHPTQKPVALLEYLIKTYTHEGELVLDNTMGSGSTGVACVNTKRDFIGMELDEEYFHIAEKRIEEAQAEIRLDV